MAALRARTWKGVVLCAAVLVTLGSPSALCEPVATNDDPSPVSLPSGQLAPETTAIRKTLESYVHAVESKDVELFRSIKPTMSEEEERRARAAFKSVQSQVVRINVLSLDVREGKATVKVTRRDTLNGSIVSSFPQTFQLVKEPAGWMIADIGR